MADTTSTTQFKADISQLKSAMQAAQRQVRLASSEFQKASAGLDDWSSSATGLNAKVKQLNSTLEAQKKMVALANEEYEKTVKVYGENSAEADRAKMKLNGYEAAVAKTEKQLNQYESELEDCKNETGRFADETDDLEDATQRASDGFTVMKGALANLVADGFRMAIDAAKEFAKQTLEVGMNFESAMSQVEAVSGATGDEIDALTEKAKEMGSTTKFTATEAAEAFNYMAMAGWKTEDMINGIDGIMNLAAASGADLATTSDIVTDALTAMGYSAQDAGKLADVMAAASSNANTNVEMMGQTFQYAAPIVGALGYNMEDTAVQIGLMANAGIKGEKAGTALRSILTRLSAPPKECADAMEELGVSLTDSEGNMKSLDEVMNDLRKAFQDLDETQQTANAKAIAGQEAMSGLLAIVNAAPADYQKLTQAVKESEGAASSMADTMNDNVKGQLTLLKSQIEGIQLQIYEKLTPALRDGIQKISETLASVDWGDVGDKLGEITTKAVDFFIMIMDNAEGVVDILQAVGTTLGTVFVVSKLLAFASGIIQLFQTMKALKTATDAATTSQLLLNAAQAATPIGLVAAAVAGITAGLIYLASKNKETAESFEILTEAEEEQVRAIHEMRQAYEDMKATRDETVDAINNEYGYYQELSNELDGLVDANGKVKEGYEDRVNFILTTLNEACGTEMELVDGVIQNYQEEKQAIEDLIQTKKAEAILRANEEGYTQAIQNQTEALQNYIAAQGMLEQNLSDLSDAEAEYNKMLNMTTAEYAEANGLTYDMGTAAQMLANEQETLAGKVQAAKSAVGESRLAYEQAGRAYSDYQATIQNYEGLSSAIISGDVDKISTALQNMQYDFQTAETSTRLSLERQVENYEENLSALEAAIQNGTPGVTQEMVDQAQSMVDAAKEELNKLPEDAKWAGEKSGKAYAEGLGSKSGEAKTAGNNVRTNANSGLQPTGDSKQSGQDFVQGYIDGMLYKDKTITATGKGLGQDAVGGLNEGQDSHSPSRATTTSGENFGQGFINGMENKSSAIWQKAWNLAKKAIAGLKAGQEEGSPSKLTYKSGVFFVQGYINGIASQQKNLQKAVKGMVTTVVKELGKMKNYNFDTVAENASTKFADQINSNVDYMLGKIQYRNEKKIAEFDKEITKLQNKQSAEAEKLQAQSDAKIEALQEKYNDTNDKALKKSLKKEIDAEKANAKKLIAQSKGVYDELIKTQNKYKSAYQDASSAMISEFQKAINDYQTKAQALIDDTINGITDKYNERYNNLIEKQTTLINKLKDTGDLFKVSGAGIMTVNDITEQTKQIKDYTNKLNKIKKKVSSELFDQIASYDMKEGSAFIDRLLAMSAEDLEAYNQAYTEKLEAAEKAGEKIYKQDFKQLSKDYKAEIKTAFKGLDKELQDLGTQAMKGFTKGLTKNTDYMSKEIKTFVKAMVNTFKTELKIKSPSRLTFGLGDFTGQGFVNGLKSTIDNVKKTAESMAQSVATPLDGIKTNIGDMKAAVGDSNGLASQNSNVVNNYNLVQNNSSPKSLSALETYQARRQQIALVKAMT